MASLVGVYNLRSSVDVARIARGMDAAGLHVRPQQRALFVDERAAIAGSVETVRTNGAGRYTVVFDGRIDNRRALLDTLHVAPGAALSDAALVAEAFSRWDTACAEKILGDFAFAVY